jgi:DNA-binding HxlR family transcriptional regulator
VKKRLYGTQDFCPIARTMNVVGDRWTILILRDLSWGRKRFADLEASLVSIGPNLLSDRLKSLETAEMIERVVYNDHPPRSMYRLTDKGKAFIPVLIALRDYGNTWELEPHNSPNPDGSKSLGERF